jgi:hypothetical protein
MAGQVDAMTGPSWAHRRTLIYGSWVLGAAMIVAGAVMFTVDMFGVGVALVTGGVSLISIILTAYTGFATFEDIKLWKDEGEPHE